MFEDLVASGRAPTLAVWNTLLAGLAAQGAWLDALSALQQVQPVLCCLHIQNCKVLDQSGGLVVLTRMPATGEPASGHA